MNVRESGDTLIIRDVPGCLWALALLFLVPGGLIVAGALGLADNAAELSPLERIAILAMGVVGYGAGLVLILREPVTTVTLDRAQGEVRVRRWGLVDRSEAVYPLASLHPVQIAEREDSDGDRTYRARLLVANEDVELPSRGFPLRSQAEEVARTLETFLGRRASR